MKQPPVRSLGTGTPPVAVNTSRYRARVHARCRSSSVRVVPEIGHRQQRDRVSLGDGSLLRAQRVDPPTPGREYDHGAPGEVFVTGQAFEDRPDLSPVQCGSQERALGLRTQLRRRYAQHGGHVRSMDRGVLPWRVGSCRLLAVGELRCHLGEVRVQRFAPWSGVDLTGQGHDAELLVEQDQRAEHGCRRAPGRAVPFAPAHVVADQRGEVLFVEVRPRHATEAVVWPDGRFGRRSVGSSPCPSRLRNQNLVATPKFPPPPPVCAHHRSRCGSSASRVAVTAFALPCSSTTTVSTAYR